MIDLRPSLKIEIGSGEGDLTYERKGQQMKCRRYKSRLLDLRTRGHLGFRLGCQNEQSLFPLH